MPWQSRLLRGERVFVKCDEVGEPLGGADGRVEVVYRPGGKVYRAGVRNLSADPAPETLADEVAGAAGSVAPAGDAIIVYTDGACSGNPGPAGLGVVILDGERRRELSEYLGIGTNNVAELMAIVRALEELPAERTILLHADSAYALGLLGKGWKAKANQELVERMRTLARRFSDLRLIKVDGHAGVPENERADALARAAVAKGR